MMSLTESCDSTSQTVIVMVFFWCQVNAISFHPVHGTLATVGSDGRFSFWDKDARTKLKTSEQLDQPITACCFNHNGNIFAYASSYDWSKVRGQCQLTVAFPLIYSSGFGHP